MLRGLLSLTLLFTWILMPGVSSADRFHAGRWWHKPLVDQKLQLTNEQKEQLDKLYYENRRKLLDLKHALEKERLELRRMVENEPFSEAEAMKQLSRLEAVRTDLATERFRFILQVRQIIGPEGFRELDALRRDHRDSRERRFRGIDEMR